MNALMCQLGLYSLNKRTDILPQNLVNYQIHWETCPIAIKFDKRLHSSAVEMPVRFQSDILT